MTALGGLTHVDQALFRPQTCTPAPSRSLTCQNRILGRQLAHKQLSPLQQSPKKSAARVDCFLDLLRVLSLRREAGQGDFGCRVASSLPPNPHPASEPWQPSPGTRPAHLQHGQNIEHGIGFTAARQYCLQQAAQRPA